MSKHTVRPADASGQGPTDARVAVTRLLAMAAAQRASDVHLEPTPDGCELRLRVDGLLRSVERFDTRHGRGLVNRLMVMAQLLTYRIDVPQEGRLSVTLPGADASLDLRLAVMPTTHGLRAVVRMPAELSDPRTLATLGLPEQVLAGLHAFAASDSGMLIVSGPAGSGKTTTVYALLAHIAERHPGQSLISLEDPVERHVPGVTQIEVQPFGALTYERALRSILRQDPQVLTLGEIRDQATASLAVQAALSGHRLICTMHAGTPAEAMARLIEMGLEPHQITGTLYAVLVLRLLRRCDQADGYRGRFPIAEWVALDAPLRAAVRERADAVELTTLVHGRRGHVTLRCCAMAAIDAGLTDAAEVDRVLGPGANDTTSARRQPPGN